MSDPIDRQAAIDAIDKYYEEKRYIKRTRTILSAICLDMKSVIQALPSAQPNVPGTNVGDMISRQAAIDAIYKQHVHGQNLRKETEDG